MRISDWSSDVCSSDLGVGNGDDVPARGLQWHRLIVKAPVAHVLDACGREQVERIRGLSQARAFPAPRCLAGEIADRRNRLGYRPSLIFQMVHRALDKAVAHELPASLECSSAGVLVYAASRAVSRPCPTHSPATGNATSREKMGAESG